MYPEMGFRVPLGSAASPIYSKSEKNFNWFWTAPETSLLLGRAPKTDKRTQNNFTVSSSRGIQRHIKRHKACSWGSSSEISKHWKQVGSPVRHCYELYCPSSAGAPRRAKPLWSQEYQERSLTAFPYVHTLCPSISQLLEIYPKKAIRCR